MKLGTVLSPEFAEVYNSLITQKIPLTAGIKLREINAVIVAKNKAYEEARQALLNDLAEKDADGKAIIEGEGQNQTFKLSEENKAKLVDELNKALQVDFDVESINAKELGDKLNISAADLMVLSDIVK
jgi:hypothetical protein